MFLRITLAHQTQKVKRAGTAAPDGDILEPDHKSVASDEKKKEDDGKLKSNQKRKKSIATQIVRPFRYPSRNKDKDYEDKEE